MIESYNNKKLLHICKKKFHDDDRDHGSNNSNDDDDSNSDDKKFNLRKFQSDTTGLCVFMMSVITVMTVMLKNLMPECFMVIPQDLTMLVMLMMNFMQ